jgi:UDP-N-acetylmuramate dehydrogenase
MNDGIVKRLKSIVGETNVRTNEPMKNHTTFKIGGSAQVFVTPEKPEQIQEIVNLGREETVPVHIIGNGSNLLVSDEGVEGIVVAVFGKLAGYDICDTTINVQAGMSLIALSNIAADEGLSGLEFASGIPGSVGGAIYMNAGAYDGQMSDVVVNVTVIDDDNNIEVLSAEDLDFGYRSSIIAKKNMIVLSARLQLTRANEIAIKSRMNEFSELRKLKQPLEYPSAGSTFKRPEGYFAGKLIADAGLKGYTVGGAQVSEKHAGFIVNTGNATAKDVVALCDYVTAQIFEKNGVKLELEVKKLGF